MKTLGLTLRASLAATILAAASNAFAFGGLFDGNLFKGANSAPEYAVESDASFFDNNELTIGGNMSPFATSASNGSYSGCASCGDSAPVVYGGGIPASADCGCNPCDVCNSCDVYDGGWVSYGVATPYRRPFRPVRNILSGVKNFLFGGRYQYCQPAYVCDPCWNVCDDCCWSPCASCETSCCGGDVYAPRGCCGDGFAPGETNPLNPATGLPSAKGGIDSGLSPIPTSNPTPIQATDDASYPGTQPAIPSSQPSSAPNGAETVPTPPANPTLGSGVLKMLVPEDSVVFVNGYRTRQTGAMRSFAANNLEYGETYSFEIRVVAVRNGQVYEDVQNATLTAGEASALAFNLNRVRDNQAVAVNR